MSNPDIQYFPSSGTWVKPEGAVRVDIVLQGAGAGTPFAVADDDESFTRANLGRRVNPNGIRCSNGEPGELRVSSWDADDLDDTVEVEVGKGGRPGGRDGYALVITHLEETGSGQPLLVERARNRAAEAARDAAECIILGRIGDARDLLAEASRHLDTAERRAEASR